MTTILIAATIGALSGATLAGGVTYRVLTRRYDLGHYAKVRLEATRVRELHDSADHYFRLARRLNAVTTVMRDHVGDLLDTAGVQRRQIADLQRRLRATRGPVPVYGVWR